jgi:predicted Abi (CAAX) family protease
LRLWATVLVQLYIIFKTLNFNILYLYNSLNIEKTIFLNIFFWFAISSTVALEEVGE